MCSETRAITDRVTKQIVTIFSKTFNNTFKYIFSRQIITLLQKYILECLGSISGLILS